MPGKYKGNGGNLTAKYVIQTADATLTGAQVLGSLATGMVLNTTTTGTGVLSIAALTGLTLSAGTLSNDFSTGKAGGLTAIGDTASAGNLKLAATAHATQGAVYIGSDLGHPFTYNFDIGVATTETGGIQIGQASNAAVAMYWTGAASRANATFDISTSGYASAIRIYGSKVALQADPSNGTGMVGIGTATLDTDASSRLRVNCVMPSATSGASFKWNGIDVMASTLTLAGATNITTTTGVNLCSFAQPTITSGSVLTVTSAATVYIADAPVAAGSTTITNKYAVWVDAGLARFDGNGTHVFEFPANATDPTGAGGAAVGRIPCLIGGALKYLAYY